MYSEHFTKTNLIELPSCFLDGKGNFILPDLNFQLGVHEALAYEIINSFGEDYYSDNYDKIRGCGMYSYQYLETLGYWRYSHWIGQYGQFNGDSSKLTHAQKLAMREFCKVHGITWDRVVIQDK